jgi:hypothetical protein
MYECSLDKGRRVEGLFGGAVQCTMYSKPD